MSIPLNVLMVENSEDDVFLVLRELRQGGYEPVFERVDTAESMQTALNKQKWDIILSGYSIPNFNGLQALECLEESRLDIPFILVSGSIGETSAVEAMKNGARDYISKNKLERLVPAVRRILYEERVKQMRKQEEDKHKQEEANQRLFFEILKRLNHTDNKLNLIDAILKLIKSHTNFEAVAIRLREGEDYPYFVQNGFSESFVESERYLCERDAQEKLIRDADGNSALECMCGNVIRDRVDVSKPFFTTGGSFWTNCTTDLLASTSEEDRQGRIRNRCNSEGYETVALIPIRSGDDIIGLLQLNDRQKGLLTLETAQFFEGLASSIGVAFQRSLAEEELRKKEDFYRTILLTAHDSFVVVDNKGRFLDVNDSYCRLIGYSREELLTMGISDVNATKTPEDIAEDIKRVIEKGSDRFETRHRHKDGRVVSLDVSVNYLDIDGGRFIAFFRDITARKQEEELRKFRAFLLDSIVDSVFIHGFDGRIFWVSETTCKTIGYTERELLSMTVQDLAAPESAKLIDSCIEILSGKGMALSEFAFIKKDGSIMPVEIHSRIFELEGKEMIACVARDITERKKMEEEAYKVKQAEEIANYALKETLALKELQELKDSLTAFLVHDLRSPLTAISGYLRFLSQSPNLNEQNQTDIAKIKQNIVLMLDMISNLLDIAKMENKEMQISVAECDIAEIVGAAINPLEPMFKRKDIHLRNEAGKALKPSPAVKCQKDLIERVIRNIVANAARFTPEGGEIVIDRKRLEQEGGMLISVSDTGIGIPEGYRGKIFDKFATVEMKRSGQRTSTGLGLTFCKYAVELHGGRIWVEERKGGGSVFKFTLPG